MATIKELLGQGDVKKHKRNFLQENVRRLKEMKPDKENKLNSQSKNSVQPLSNRRNAQENFQKLASSPPPNCRLRSSLSLPRKPGMGIIKSLTIEETQKQRNANCTTTKSEDFTSKGYRNQASQTLNGQQLETMYYEGIIRYPSARAAGASVSVREMGLQTESQGEVLHSPPPNISPMLADTGPNSRDIGLQGDEDLYSAVNKDFVKINANIPEPPRTKSTDSKPDPNRAPLTYQRGVVPRYLKAHKKEQEKERINRAREAADECPEGHVMLPDDIRLSHLVTLKQKYEELVSRLNQLPVSTDTLRIRNRKKQIEEELDKIEVAIALFSREKVFVKANS